MFRSFKEVLRAVGLIVSIRSVHIQSLFVEVL